MHDAFEMIACRAGSYSSSLTPSTSVRSGCFAGAEMITFFAPAARCFAASSRFVNRPVDSTTTSTPSSPHGRAAGSRSEKTLKCVSPTRRPSPSTATSASRLPRTESYLKRWASVSGSVMSLTATKSMAPSACSIAARMMFRPIRPNPLMPTFVPIYSILLEFPSRDVLSPAAVLRDADWDTRGAAPGRPPRANRMMGFYQTGRATACLARPARRGPHGAACLARPALSASGGASRARGAVPRGCAPPGVRCSVACRCGRGRGRRRREARSAARTPCGTGRRAGAGRRPG